jgi:hypothetical protein
MKCCIAAALALVGWYLMVPPDKPGPPPRHPNDLAPLVKWTIVSSFDTAAECQKRIAGEQNDIANNARPADAPILFELVDSQECIASDDPRLKGN